ncbi:Na+/H+ antiporter subunit D [Corynebacterium casei]|uniref:Monovalent cation/H+ antiporter subunit D n=1 Tax=Corynebacterium casei LMG S-19264 TaxID=1285583 RepID=A0ABM5PT14_9CORY|nr:Na+/H+ antiporter subunit D [Corynebacterium casei]AHI21086.1 monovalent cation/H+ antiporter subunit D [Corynebacterium casei LMG S-19264]MDN5903411.1 Na+/H+ antiporter subunit D [Corynebacterium casei]MDN6154491.1 Na+/H+ antiporter subunit D [Corynebacterium casei]MDN6627448.1 Na+/H+ antiporter subunit D [Corynebacterium casei]MDN6672907.1 Na+/H+ antiporter subunit D [Corynebacterium casei]
MSDLIASYVELVLPYITYLIPMPVLIPVAGAALTLLLSRFRRAQSQIAFIMLALSSLVSLTLLAVADVDGIQTLQIGGWDAPVGITLVADRLSTVMLFTSSIVLFSVMWYAISQGVRDGGEDEPVTVFLPTYMLLTMGVNVSFLAGDLFNLYVGFEIFLVASYVLLTLGASPARVRAGVGYVMVSMVSSMIFLLGIGLTYAAVGTVNMAQIGIRIADIPEGTRTAIFGVLLVAFGIKAAVVPLDAWLPDSYPTAPALVTAVFAGLLTKVGVYSIIRMRSAVFTDGSLDTLLMWVALATMIVGILGAMAQTDIKRLLSFTLVSHIGYMIFGVALGTAQGLSGAIFYAVHHILVQTALFLVVGLIERQSGTSSLRRLGSLLYTAPVISILYFIPAINLGGIPPFSGFMGKILLLQAGANEGSWLAWVLIGGAVVTSLLTLYVMVLVWSKGFLRDRADAPEGHVALARPAPLADITDEVEYSERADVGRLPFGMFASTALLVTASTVITFVAGPVSGITSRSAESAQDQTIYQDAVLGEHYDNPTRHLDPQDRYVDGDSIENRDHLLPEPEPAANGSNTNSDTGTDNATESGEDEQ